MKPTKTGIKKTDKRPKSRTIFIYRCDKIRSRYEYDSEGGIRETCETRSLSYQGTDQAGYNVCTPHCVQATSGGVGPRFIFLLLYTQLRCIFTFLIIIRYGTQPHIYTLILLLFIHTQQIVIIIIIMRLSGRAIAHLLLSFYTRVTPITRAYALTRCAKYMDN